MIDFYFLLIRNGEDTWDECYQGLGSVQEEHHVEAAEMSGFRKTQYNLWPSPVPGSNLP